MAKISVTVQKMTGEEKVIEADPQETTRDGTVGWGHGCGDVAAVASRFCQMMPVGGGAIRVVRCCKWIPIVSHSYEGDVPTDAGDQLCYTMEKGATLE